MGGLRTVLRKESRSGLTRRQFGASGAGLGLLANVAGVQTSGNSPVLPGVWRFRLGTPERLTPVSERHYQPASERMSALPEVSSCPIPPSSVRGKASARGYEVALPLAPGEMVYGLGLQLLSFLQRGLKKKLRVNADPIVDLGDANAPVPFYLTTHGYGVFIDTARYLNIYCGNKVKKDAPAPAHESIRGVEQLPEEYSRFRMGDASEVLIEVPEAAGVDIYVLGGPTMRAAVQRYNLFSGGGPIPPRWGLSFWYRCYGKANQDEVVGLADELRKARIPCDVLGLEPGWQSHSYSCSFKWSDAFPDPGRMIGHVDGAGYKLNLWEHAFTHPTAPIHQELLPHSGDYLVWEGLVPDFLGKEARQIFGGYHEREFVSKGIAGFKLDECDNSDYTRNWSFPELSRFPSGADGEQMHSFFGLRYQDTIQGAFDGQKKRTLGLVRSSHALAAPYPYVLYSDLYDHEEFIRGVANAGFSGLLWCPEVRDAKDTEDLLRRLQTVIFSPLAMINAWYIKNPPWKQVDREKNNAGEFAAQWEELEAACRKLIEVRMQLVPYLYAAYIRYHLEGIPPFRALVMDYPNDPNTWIADQEYLAGDSLLVAPLTAGRKEREIYLPEGEWFDFWTGEMMPGAQRFTKAVPLDRIPVYVKSGTLLPLAQPTLHTGEAEAFQLTVRVYGNGGSAAVLFEDDGSTTPTFTRVTLAWDEARGGGTLRRNGPAGDESYSVREWQQVRG